MVEKPTCIVGVRDTGDVGAPATLDSIALTNWNNKRTVRLLMLDTWIICNLMRVPLRTRELEEGVVVTDGEWSPQPVKKINKWKHRAKEKDNVASTALRRKGMTIHR
jgi:hypothetical protein